MKYKTFAELVSSRSVAEALCVYNTLQSHCFYGQERFHFSSHCSVVPQFISRNAIGLMICNGSEYLTAIMRVNKIITWENLNKCERLRSAQRRE